MGDDDTMEEVVSLQRWDGEGGAGVSGSQVSDAFATSPTGTLQMRSSDGKPSWEQPDNVKVPEENEAGKLARKHGISPDRAQMLIDRLGHDPKKLAAAAEALRINPR